MVWNFIIKTHVDFGNAVEALSLYRRMRGLSLEPDSFTFPIINRAILLLGGNPVYDKMIHCVAEKMGFGLDLYFCNTMIEVYGKCGCADLAQKVFDGMLERDLVSWTSIISVYVREVNVGNAFKLFKKMRLVVKPNFVTLIVLLQGCSVSESSIEGRQLHGYSIQNGLLIDGSVQNSILKLYARTGSVKEVQNLFSEIDPRDTVSWNTLISYYSLRGDVAEVADSFQQMLAEEMLSVETLTLVISAFTKCENLMQGKKLHSLAIKVGLCDHVLQTSLLDFYAKCGNLESSACLFRDIPDRNAITWSAMMSGFIQNGYSSEAITLFQQLQGAGFEPGADILRSLVDASANLGALRLGKGIHAYLIRNLLYKPGEGEMHLETSILNMYMRCGNIFSATECFKRMMIKDVVTWTSMIEGYGTHGLGLEALKLFHQMVEGGIKPASVTFLSLLSACSHSALVSAGCEVFSSMRWGYGIEPDLDHYTCLVDLLGRSGNLKVALAIIMKMAIQPDSRIWGALLAASRVHGDRKLGGFAAERLLELEPDNVGYYTLMSNMKASIHQWAEVEEVRRMMNEKDLKKKPGWSYIEENGRIHGFVSGDKSHNQVEEIHELLRHLSNQVQEIR